MSLNDRVSEIKKKLIKSLKLRTRSDVPIAFTLSGGVDSVSLASIASKELNLNIKTYSIIDDERYNESKNINIATKDINCKNKKINLKNENNFNNLFDIINYNEKPLSSIAQYNHSVLMRQLHKDGFKVCINGTMADELFAGYYDHHLMYFSSIKNEENFLYELKIWKNRILPSIRNSYFKKFDLYIKNKNFRKHIYDNHNQLKQYLNIKQNIILKKKTLIKIF